MKRFFLASIISALLPSFANATDVDVDKFKSIIVDKNTIILDVRTESEFNEGHIKGAINIDFNSKDFEKNILKLDKDKTYALYCRSGNRSGKALKVMEKGGYKKLFNLIGGLSSPTNYKALNVIK